MTSLSQDIAPHLPYLRRFSRALSGTQDRGDYWVARTLERIVADPNAFPRANSSRIALYKAFLQTWNGAEPGGEQGGSQGGHAPESRLDAIGLQPRQAFLLTSVEGFTVDDAAEILGVDMPEVLQLLDSAGQQIADQMATDVVIIEDEPLVAMDLESIVTSLGHRVVGMARTHSEAVAAVDKHRPGLVLADIQLADGSSGLQAVNEILQTKDLPVIFITAFPERLLTGVRPEPVFLITKPFRVDAVKAILSQVLFFNSKSKAGAGRSATG